MIEDGNLFGQAGRRSWSGWLWLLVLEISVLVRPILFSELQFVLVLASPILVVFSETLAEK